MTTLSARLGIAKPTPADDFDTAEIAANWQLVDDHPGVYICTSGTRPTWGAAQEGMLIFETDTNLYWWWDGSAFTRVAPRGWLNGASRTTPVTETAGISVAMLTAAVTIPSGGRRVAITCGWPSASGDGVYHLGIQTGTAAGPYIRKWGFFTGNSGGGSVTHYDNPSAGAITYCFSLVKVSGTTCTVGADSSSKITLDVVEV